MKKEAWKTADEQIAAIIAEERTEDYDRCISDIDDWYVFYHLSSLRHSLLNWYEFRENARILEVGSGFGALTGLLLDRAEEVDAVEADPVRADALDIRFRERKNLMVCRENIDVFRCEEPYDYIVLVDFFEEYAGDRRQLLVHLGGMLRAGGRLLLGFRSREGFKYQAGASDEYTNRSFPECLKEMPDPGCGGELNLLTAPEIGGMLEDTGFAVLNRLYPLPDLHVVHALYTDDWLPEKSVSDRVICYDALSDSLDEDPRILLEKAVREKRLPEAANAVLIEAVNASEEQETSEKKVIYACSSTDRGREHGFSTILYSDGTAVKRAMYPEGERFLEKTAENSEKLRERGLAVVPQERILSGGRTELHMPLQQIPSAADWICAHAADREALLGILDTFYQDILRSSDTVQITDHEAEREWGYPAAQLGPLLAHGYLEMMPYNCFYDNGVLRYFDQEFVRRDCPAGYVMFRVLKYMWTFAPDTRRTIRPEELKQRYGLAVPWRQYEQAEALFGYENRNIELFQQFFSWTAVDPESVRKRAERRSRYPDRRVRENRKKEKVRRIQLELLQVFDRVCREHGLRYTAVFGTLLGAVRHQGFIPWDDDIDLAMPREDYDRLTGLAGKVFSGPYFLQTPESDPNCFYGGYARLRHSRTTAIESRNAGAKGNQGIWIEIFPLDPCGLSDREINAQQRKVFFVQRLLFAKVYPLWTGMIADSDPRKVSLYYILADRFSHAALCSMLHRVLSSHKKTGCRTVFATYYRWKKNWSRMMDEDLDDLIRIPFEDTEIPVPRAYDRWLTERYGKNYMEFPPPETRHPRHDVQFDPDKPYTEYL